MNKIACIIIGGLGVAITLISAILLGQFPNIIEKQVKKQLVIKECSEAYKQFRAPAVPIYFKIHFFNVDNPDEIMAGKKPKLTEMGPYVWLEKRHKTIDEIFEDEADVVTYREKKTYIFQPHLSKGDLSDEVTLVNIPALTVSTAAFKLENPNLAGLFRSFLKKALEETNGSLFEKHTVEEVAFKGYHLNFIGVFNELLGAMGNINVTEFAFFMNKNETNDGVFRVNTGFKDISQLMSIEKWNDESEVTYWKNGSSCNKIVGTDGSGFAPNVKKDSQLKIFNTELGRTFPLEFDSKEKVKGIKTNRFIVPSKAFQSPENNPDNECYCLEHPWSIDKCSQDGLLDISTLRQGAPLVASAPHFFQGNESLHEAVDGLAKPSADKDITYLNIEPMTGKCLKAAKRLQISVVLTPKYAIKLVKKVKELMLPTIWVEESFELTDDLAEEFKSKVTKKVSRGSGLLITALILGTLLIVAGLGLFFYAKFKTGR